MTSLDHAHSCVIAALEPKREDGASVALHVLVCQTVVLVPRQASIRHPRHGGMRLEELRDLRYAEVSKETCYKAKETYQY